jgi:hypothetical protein
VGARAGYVNISSDIVNRSTPRSRMFPRSLVAQRIAWVSGGLLVGLLLWPQSHAGGFDNSMPAPSSVAWIAAVKPELLTTRGSFDDLSGGGK